MSADIRNSLRVIIYDGNHFSREGAADQRTFNIGENATKDITEYVSSIRWSFLVNSPYEKIDMNLAIPFSDLYHTLPGRSKTGYQLDTGFWVTVYDSSFPRDADDKRSKGKLLAWGRVVTLNFTRKADLRSGSVTAMVSLSADSWVNFLDQNNNIATEVSEFPKDRIRKNPKSRAAAKSRWKKTSYNEAEIIAFEKGFFSAAIPTPKILGRNDPRNVVRLQKGSLGYAASRLYHTFAKNTYLPVSMTGKVNGEIVNSDDPAANVDFSSITQFVYAPKELVASQGKVSPPDPLAADLSRFGRHHAVPLGNGRRLRIDSLQGGIWSNLTRTFGVDPNLVEMFPTLVEIDPDSAFVNSPDCDKSVRETSYILDGDDSLPDFFSPYKLVEDSEGPNRMMVPAILYRLKPINSGHSYAPGFNTTLHNELAASNNDPKPYPDTNHPTESILHAGRFPHFYFDPAIPTNYSEYIIEVNENEISELTFQISENEKYTAVSIRPLEASNEAAGFGFSLHRKPVMNEGLFADYGFRHYEFNLGLTLSGSSSGSVPDMVKALSEYGYALLDQRGNLGRGYFSCSIRPEIRAGTWVDIEFADVSQKADDRLLGRVYVEEVTHSVDVSSVGAVSSMSMVKFSMGSFFHDGSAFFTGLEERF